MIKIISRFHYKFRRLALPSTVFFIKRKQKIIFQPLRILHKNQISQCNFNKYIDCRYICIKAASCENYIDFWIEFSTFTIISLATRTINHNKLFNLNSALYVFPKYLISFVGEKKYSQYFELEVHELVSVNSLICEGKNCYIPHYLKRCLC